MRLKVTDKTGSTVVDYSMNELPDEKTKAVLDSFNFLTGIPAGTTIEGLAEESDDRTCPIRGFTAGVGKNGVPFFRPTYR